MKIAHKINIGVLAATLIPMVITLIASNFMMKKSINESYMDKVRGSMDNTIKSEFSNMIVTSRNYIKFLAMDSTISNAAYYAIEVEKNDDLKKLLPEIEKELALSFIEIIDLKGKIVISTIENRNGIQTTGDDFFKQAIEGNQVALADIDRNTGQFMIHSAASINRKNKTLAVIHGGYIIDKTLLSRLNSEDTGIFIFSEEGKLIAAGTDENIPDNYAQKKIAYINENLKKIPDKQRSDDYSTAEIDTIDTGSRQFLAGSTAIQLLSNAPVGFLFITKDTSKMNHDIMQVTSIILLFLSIFCLLSILGSIILSKSFTKPITKSVFALNNVSRGDLSQRIEVNSKDEIGDLSRAINKMCENLETKASMASAIAEGDLTHEVQLSSKDDSLGKSLQTMNRNLNQILSEINSAVIQVASGSVQVSGSSQSLSQGATEQASALEEITSSLTEIGSQTSTNAANAGQVETLSAKARQAAQNGVKQMNEVTSAMATISESSKEIRKIISAIDNIAFQTNLLALNAAVEAARAGKHGKGFAVVAQEVRSLAGRSAKAAEETTQLIESAGKRITDGNAIVEATAKTLSQIEVDTTKMADLIGEIASASNEQAQGLSQVTQGLSQIDSVTQQNTAHAEETSAAATELASQAANVRQLLSRFRLKDSQTGQPNMLAFSQPVVRQLQQ